MRQFLQSLGRRRPGAFLAGAALAGAVVGRLAAAKRKQSSDEGSVAAVGATSETTGPGGATALYPNAMPVRDHIRKIVGAADPLPSAVVLDIGVNAQLDITSCDMLVELADTLRAAGVDLALAEVHGPVGAMVVSSGVLAHLGADRVFRTLDLAVEALGDPTGDIAYS